MIFVFVLNPEPVTVVHEHMPGCSHLEFMENVVSPINQCLGILKSHHHVSNVGLLRVS